MFKPPPAASRASRSARRCWRTQRVNAALGGRLFIKAECLQRTGSFKLRGAYNFLASMSEAERKKGVVGWSSGNHAQGLAEAARLLGVKATIVMPADAPALKVANTRASGAEVVLYDRVKDSREEIGLGIAAEDRRHGRAALRSSLDPDRPGHGRAGDRRAGQGAGRHARCRRRALLGRRPVDRHRARPSRASAPPPACMPANRRASTISRARWPRGTKQTNAKLSGSICDALLAPTPGDVTFPLAQKLLGPGLVVSDDEVLDAMEVAFREFKLVVEPGGAVALAAALTGKLPVKGRAVAVVCSGGNVDHATFVRALSRHKAA